MISSDSRTVRWADQRHRHHARGWRQVDASGERHSMRASLAVIAVRGFRQRKLLPNLPSLRDGQPFEFTKPLLERGGVHSGPLTSPTRRAYSIATDNATSSRPNANFQSRDRTAISAASFRSEQGSERNTDYMFVSTFPCARPWLEDCMSLAMAHSVPCPTPGASIWSELAVRDKSQNFDDQADALFDFDANRHAQTRQTVGSREARFRLGPKQRLIGDPYRSCSTLSERLSREAPPGQTGIERRGHPGDFVRSKPRPAMRLS